jgi:hypothetical protein
MAVLLSSSSLAFAGLLVLTLSSSVSIAAGRQLPHNWLTQLRPVKPTSSRSHTFTSDWNSEWATLWLALYCHSVHLGLKPFVDHNQMTSRWLSLCNLVTDGIENAALPSDGPPVPLLFREHSLPLSRDGCLLGLPLRPHPSSQLRSR